MNFVNTHYLPHIVIGSLLLITLLAYLNHKYFKWVKTYWFFERSWLSRISSFFYVVSLILMLSSLLDLRGPEEKIKSNLPDQKTILILDSSASMLAEDVRPNRFAKALQVARHFVKNAAGHQISIVLFSDIQKKLIPFTDDIDLLDSRLAALEKTNAVNGGSNISQAIAEAVGYFGADDAKDAKGNIIVFTDAEESEGSFDIELGKDINLAVIGIGTAKGSSIPLRWEDGSFRGYKTSKGQTVTTKLDENYIKKIGKNVKNYKYWIINSYSLPTDEIMNFFRSTYSKSNGKGDMRVRPVYSHLVLIPAIIIFCISIVLGRFASFKTVVSLLLVGLITLSNSTFAKDDEKKPKEIPAPLLKDMEKIKSGRANRKEVLKLAEKFLKNKDEERATELYSEYAKKDDEDQVKFNQATALMKTNKLDEALPLVDSLLKNSSNEDLKNKLRQNLLLALNNEKQQQQNKDSKKDDKKKDDKDKNDKDKDGKDEKEGKDGKDKKDDKKSDKENKENDKKDNGKDSKEDNKDQKDSKDSKGDQNQSKDKSDKDKKDEEKDQKDPKDLEKHERPESSPKSLEEKEKMIQQKRKMVKTPALIKQIMSDDRELQKKLMDTSTNERGDSKPKRDW